MKITVKLFATLSELLPPDAQANTVEIEMPESTTLDDVIDRFHVPCKMAHLVLCNGVFIKPEERNRPLLQDGDTIAIWPPIAGG